MKKVAVIYLSHDGFTSLYTGVGTVARDFLFSFPNVCKSLKKSHPGIKIDLFATTLKYNETCFGYSKEVYFATISLEKRNKNIKLVELINGSAGIKSFGDIELWRNACISAATFVYTVVNNFNYDKVIVVCVDTPFAHTPKYFFEHYPSLDVEFVWLPQSTVAIHKYDSALGNKQKQQAYYIQRYTWEKEIIDMAKGNPKLKIGLISKFMRQHLIDNYGAAKNTLISLQNGLFFKRMGRNKTSQDNIAKILIKYQVPLNRPIIFSFGRAEPYKGLDLVLKNANFLIEKYNFFVLIFASPYSMQDPYVSALNDLGRKYPNDCKIVYGLDFTTPQKIIQWKKTYIAAFFSRAEPFGLIPVEVRFYKNKYLSLITSDIDGYSEQIDNGVDGFKTKLLDKEIRNTFDRVAKLPLSRKEKMSQKGYEKVLMSYNQEKINLEFFKNYLLKL